MGEFSRIQREAADENDQSFDALAADVSGRSQLFLDDARLNLDVPTAAGTEVVPLTRLERVRRAFGRYFDALGEIESKSSRPLL